MRQKSSTIFRPATDTHAIVEAVFHLEFENELSPVQVGNLQQKILENPVFREFFTAKPKLLRGVEYNTPAGDDHPPSFSSVSAGVKMALLSKKDNHVSWILELNPLGFSIHCFDYTRWDDKDHDPVWPKVNRFLTVFLSMLGQAEIDATRLGLKFVDDFILDEVDGNYALNALFDPTSAQKLLPSNIWELEYPERWHSSNGWFHPHKLDDWKKAEILSQLNVMSDVSLIFEEEKSPGKNVGLIRIEHSSALVAGGENLHIYENLPENLTKIYNYLHNQNKILICRLLTKEMQERIKVKVDVNESHR